MKEVEDLEADLEDTDFVGKTGVISLSHQWPKPRSYDSLPHQPKSRAFLTISEVMIGQLSHSLPIRDLLPAQSSVRKQFIVYLEWQVRVRTALSLR